MVTGWLRDFHSVRQIFDQNWRQSGNPRSPGPLGEAVGERGVIVSKKFVKIQADHNDANV